VVYQHAIALSVYHTFIHKMHATNQTLHSIHDKRLITGLYLCGERVNE
jgi:hypothetical protein